MKKVEVEARAEPIRVAPVTTREEVIYWLSELEKESPYYRAGAELMLQSGLRIADINGAQWHHVSFTASEVHLIVSGGKNHRSLLVRDTWKCSLRKLTPWLQKWLREGKSTRPRNENLMDVCTTEFAKVLSRIAGRQVTSYSIRRLRLQEIIEECTEGGVVNWEKAKRLSFHRTDQALRSTYQNRQED